jgi:hypothetical protein
MDAVTPMKAMIAEKMILLIVPGSHRFEELLSCGMFGVIAGLLGGAIVPDDEGHGRALGVA